jgi:peptidoglycan-associated lipoprotein
MTKWRNTVFCWVILSAVFSFSGCSSTNTESQFVGVAETPQVETKVKSLVAQATGISSLEALQRGESLVTSASSPLKDIYFDFDRYDLRADTRETLKANAAWLRDNLTVVVDVEGHCDERGTNDYNMALGAKRAQEGMDYLITLGVAAGRLSTTSYGEEVPVCQEHAEECWAKNRRDRFVIQDVRPAS